MKEEAMAHREYEYAASKTRILLCQIVVWGFDFEPLPIWLRAILIFQTTPALK